MSYYDTLEVTPNASDETIKAAYKALCKKYHPDICGGSEEKMKLINEAYKVLSDRDSRSVYDETLKNNHPHKEESASSASDASADSKNNSDTEGEKNLTIGTFILGLIGIVFYGAYYLIQFALGLFVIIAIIGFFTGHSQAFIKILFDGFFSWILGLLS